MVVTDLLQTIVMFVGLILILIFGSQSVGGFEKVWRLAGEGMRLNVWE